ncbi:MAG: PD-(D/E)XK nuclease family protein [Bradymonadales bacterium]|nr:PD-(D/E)XK nuclease family protein [Bradymonadales bacterium]
MSWLEPLFDDTQPGATTLVLCHSAATVAMIRREIARRKGTVGITVTTPLGLARALQPVDLAASDGSGERVELSHKEPSGRLWARVADRPGLRRLLLQHVDRARLIGPAAAPLDLGLAELVEQEFEESTGNRACRALLDRARECGSRLGVGHDYCRVLAVGFGDEGAGLVTPEGPAAFYRELLAALGAERLSPPILHHGPLKLEVIQATDVVGEARWVAAQVARHIEMGGDPDRVLVLIPGRQDGDRIRSALARSGIPAADDGARPLSEHSLAALLFRVLPWFDELTDPAIEVDGLKRLLQSRLLGHVWTHPELAQIRAETLGRIEALGDPGANQEESEELGEGSEGEGQETIGEQRQQEGRQEGSVRDPLFLSRRQVVQVLRACHLVKAPLSVWIRALQEVASSAGPRLSLRRQALLIKGRLLWLQRCRGEVEGTRLVGQLAAFLEGFGIKTFSGQPDYVAEAIRGALSENRELPATRENLEDALAGAVASGELHQGIVLLPYRYYDGRDAELLLVTGLHSKGLGQCPSPDPFFDPELLARLGVYQGECWLDLVEGQLVAALRRAGEARGCLARFDASGRAAAPHLVLGIEDPDGGGPPVTLILHKGQLSTEEQRPPAGPPGDPSRRPPKAGAVARLRAGRVTNYGLRLDSPETRDLGSIERRLEPAPLNPPNLELDAGTGVSVPTCEAEGVSVMGKAADRENGSPPDRGFDRQRQTVAEAVDASHHAALMASVEWLRAGSHLVGFQPRRPLPADPTLLDYLARYTPAIPDWAALYLGDARTVPGAGLSEETNLSATYGFEPMTHCLFQAFAKVLLRLREPETIGEDLDAREIGRAAHEALRRLGRETCWRVEVARQAEAIEYLVKILCDETGRQVEAVPAATQGLRESRQGMLQRWSVHWRRYVEKRVEVLDPDGDADKAARAWLKNGPELAEVAQWLEFQIDQLPRPWKPKDRGKKLKELLSLAAAALANGEEPWSDDVFGGSKLPGVGRRAVESVFPESGADQRLDRLAESYRLGYRTFRARYGPILVGVPEWSFGKTQQAPDGPARHIRLGEQQVQVNGAVDLIRVTGAPGCRSVSVIDYKSGGGVRGKTDTWRGFVRGTMAQVPLYALVLKQALEEGWGPEGVDPTELPFLLVHDFLKRPGGKKVELSETLDGVMPPGDFILGEFEQLLGNLVARMRQGEFFPVPHSDTCPVLGGRYRDYCAFGDLCRIRSWPGAEVALVEEEEASQDMGETP